MTPIRIILTIAAGMLLFLCAYLTKAEAQDTINGSAASKIVRTCIELKECAE